MLQAIIFDLDGVLVDTEPQYYEVTRRMLAEYGADLTVEHFSQYFGTSPTILWNGMKETYHITEPVEQLVSRFLALRNQLVAEQGLIRYPYLEDTLKLLQDAGYLMAVASGSAMLIQTLCQLGIQDYFSASANTAECKRAKPWPDVFLLAAERLGVEPKNCLVVEDGVNGMHAARRAGMSCVGFSGSRLPSDMSPVSCSISSYQGLTPADFEGFYEAGLVFHLEASALV